MSGKEQKSDWLYEHPRQGLQLTLTFVVALFHLPVAIISLLLFILLVRLLKLDWKWLLAVGLSVAVVGYFVLEMRHQFSVLLTELGGHLWLMNKQLLITIYDDGFMAGLHFIYEAMLASTLSLPLLVTGLLAMLNLISNSPHEKSLRALHRAKGADQAPPIKEPQVEKLLAKLDEKTAKGTLLGVSLVTRRAVVIPDSHVNQMILVLGTTGSGKTVTLRRFYQRAMYAGYPLVIVDGKPTDENIAWVSAQASQYQRPFYGFNCGNYYHYDCLAHGGYTELKDKIIGLKDQWENDYYRSIAEDYLQTTLEVLIKRAKPFDLAMVIACLDYGTLAAQVRMLADEALMARVRRLEAYDRKDITGLQAHLNLLIHSELGHYFERTEKLFSLSDVIANHGVVYFALPALRFPGFSKVLGKLVINDLKAVVDRHTGERLFTVFDEFSVFAGEQVLNLVNMGRGKGVHAIFGTQGVADLQKVDQAFASQVLNCVNTVICHRLNDQDSAEAIAGWVGTRDSYDLTAQISSGQGSTGMGSIRRNKSYIVHPDEIKQALQPGEAYYISKVGQFQQDKVKVKYT